MDGSQPVRITRDGDHQVVHLPSGVSAPADAVVRQDGERLIIERAGLRMGSVERLLAVLSTMEPIDERLDPFEDPPPEPVDL
ncbi:MAG: hypothetical protein B7Z13_16005 [Caulobacterales bacterium 32-67-6]|nr:MAG: hypothetical protein B7Z13_16005 [Caulobacterales bacterium 32-67-6]